jgi:hypothetical protein
VEERHAGVAHVVGAEAEVVRDGHADRQQLEVVVVDALRQAGGARRVDHHERRHRVHVGRRCVEALVGGTDLLRQRRLEVRRIVGVARRLQDEDVLGCDGAQLTADLLDLRPEPLVDDQETRARRVDHAGQRVAAEPRVHAEQGRARVAAGAIQREQLEMVLEQHRDVGGPGVVHRAEAALEEVAHAD